MFFGLPVELRLRIAEYAFEGYPTAGLPQIQHQLQTHEHSYKASENLALLLVCRRFHIDFAQLAYNATRFTLCRDTNQALIRLHELPDHKVRNIRNLVFHPDSELSACGRFFLETPQLCLDELVLPCSNWWAVGRESKQNIALFLRRLSNVKIVKFVMYEKRGHSSLSQYCSLVGAIMQQDHYQRYDAPGAPNIEATWWEWHLNALDNIITFEAHDSRPVLPEEEYMLLMKPRVEALMATAEKAAGL